jgi:hypothetical protein
MKFNSKLVVLVVSLLLTVGAFAGDTHKASLQTLDTLQVNGKSLPAGEYKVTWEGNGPAVQLNILKNGQVVATSSAQVVELNNKPANDAAVTAVNPDGTKTLQEIRFAGKKFAFALGPSAQAQMKGSDASK